MPPSEAGYGRDVGVAVPAAGLGRRLGGVRKAFLELGGDPLLALSLRPFLAHPRVRSVVVALPAEEAADPPAWLRDLDDRIRLVEGGATRLHSVGAALSALDPSVEVVLVHDAARPFVTRAIIDRCLEVAERGEGAVAALPSTDTLKEVDGSGRILSTPDRESVWRAQTPQAFPRADLLDAYRHAMELGLPATDDAALFSRWGGRVRVVRGSTRNLKITHPDDLVVARALLALGDGDE